MELYDPLTNPNGSQWGFQRKSGKALLALVFFGAFAFGLLSYLYDQAALGHRGQEAIATVTEVRSYTCETTRARRRRRIRPSEQTCFDHWVSIDGLPGLHRVSLADDTDLGATVNVTYDPKDLAKIQEGRRPTWRELIGAGYGSWVLWALAICLLVCGMAVRRIVINSRARL